MALWRQKIDRFSSDTIIPGRTEDPGGWVDLLRSYDGINGPIPLVLSRLGIRDLAAKHPQIGLVPKERLDEALERNVELELRNGSLEARVADLEQFKASVAGVTKEDYVIRKPQGRPPIRGDK